MHRVWDGPRRALLPSRIVFLQARLQAVQLRVSAAGSDQLLMRAVLDQAAALDGDDTIGKSQRRETMRDDDHGPAARHLRHVLLHDALAFIIERARRLVE